MDIKERLNTNRLFMLGEILLVFAAAFTFIQLLMPLVSEHAVLTQVVIWTANILMLLLIWVGMQIRGEKWEDFGLSLRNFSWKAAGRIFLLSLLVFFLAMVGFVLGSIIMVNITGMPQNADMSGYDYLRDNIGMLILTLAGVYIVSSFGEEFIYRAFLINRITTLAGNHRMGSAIAIVISAVIFGLVHYQWGPMGIVQTAFMGLALGICYVKLKKRLWILVLAHAYMDTILMIQMYLAM